MSTQNSAPRKPAGGAPHGHRAPAPPQRPPEPRRMSNSRPNPQGQGPNKPPRNQAPPPRPQAPPPQSVNIQQLRQYMQVLDNDPEKVKAFTKGDLMTILLLCENKKEYMGKTRAPVWFRLLEKKLGEFTVPELFRLWGDLDRSKMDPNKFEVATFFPEWQKWVALRMTPEFIFQTIKFHRERLRPFSAELMTKWGNVVEPLISSWSVDQMFTVLMFFCDFRQRPDDNFLKPLVVRLLKEMDSNNSMDHVQLANFVYAMGKLWVPYENMLEAVKKLINENKNHKIVKDMDGTDMIRVLEGLIELKLDPSKYSEEDSFMQYWFEIVTQTMKSLINKHLAQSAWLLSRLNIAAQDDFIEKYREGVQQKMPDFSAGEVHMVLLGFKHMNIKAIHSEDKKAVTIELVNELHMKMDDMWPQALSPMLLDLDHLGVIVPQEMKDNWMKQCELQMGGMLVSDITRLLETMVKLDIEVTGEFKAALLDQLSNKIVDQRLIKGQVEEIVDLANSLNIEIPDDLEKKMNSVAEKAN